MAGLGEDEAGLSAPQPQLPGGVRGWRAVAAAAARFRAEGEQLRVILARFAVASPEQQERDARHRHDRECTARGAVPPLCWRTVGPASCCYLGSSNYRGDFVAENRDKVPTIFGGATASCCYQAR